MKDQPVIFFDGVCNLCNHLVQFLIRRDRKKQFLFASLQGNNGREILNKHKLSPIDQNSFILLDNGIVYTKSTAALKTLKKLGGGWKLFYGFIILPKFVRDSLYTLIANNRYRWFGKKDECMIPSPEIKNRFLD